MRTYYAWLCVAVLSGTLCAESFVLPKKKQSTHTLKENCNDLLFEALKLSPKISKHNADVQQLSMNMVPSMLEGTFFSSMSTVELDVCCKELQRFYERQEMINALLEEQCALLRKLEAHSKKKQ
ncbi:MAG: hypothetical protein ACHQVS_05055 [Candidatus Babeliales bacterium]